MLNVVVCVGFKTGIDPIKILQRKIYSTLLFKPSDWLKCE